MEQTVLLSGPISGKSLNTVWDINASHLSPIQYLLPNYLMAYQRAPF